ncbi:citrate synthase [Gryllotalpicola daejeonensis]|uniref:citrate synthase (unknown stereospecificity) n=1 Tax=Gryllotalpicola daejeonensis TaxID=993087 RepID=A0ABP7ZIE4_9MICO
MTDPQPLPRLTAAQAAARLGVKQATLYAYVSRGLLARERTASGSSFDPLEIEGFARARTRRSEPRTEAPAAGHAARPAGSPLMVLDTDVAEIADDELFYRGRPVTELLDRPLGEVAAWLWQSAGDAAEASAARAASATSSRPLGDAAQTGAQLLTSDELAAARAAIATLPADAAVLDRIHVAVLSLAAADPLRYDASGEGLRRVGARLLAGIPRALSPARPDALATASTAELLWPALTDDEPSAAGIRALNAALVLLIDHDLAVSTLAARVAASARASGYATVTAALGAFDSPLHGNASRAAAAMLAQVVAGAAPAAALAAAIRDGGGVPGLGQPLYSGTDARAAALLPLIGELDGGPAVLAAVDAVVAEVHTRAAQLHPNVDLALAALALAAGMRPDAGVAIFAVGRTVGWIAHALAEYEERPLRLRPRGRYVGP